MAAETVLRSRSIHLVLKWTGRYRPDTIELHQAVVRDHGAVWWGRVSTPGSRGLGARWVDKMRDQIDQGVATFAYLRGPTTWRARMLDITLDEVDDEARIPPYYAEDGSHHSLWVLLNEFVEVDQREIQRHFVRATDGAPVTAGGLRNQTPVLLMASRTRPIPRDSAGAGEERGPRRPRLPPLGPREPLTLDRLRAAVAEARLMIEPRILAQLAGHLESGKHVILTGPPGTAKTSLARVVAGVAEEANWSRGHVVTTATSDWTTYETIGGLREVPNGGLQFESGHFLDAIETKRWLVIDELNRSNLDRAFGALFTVLSGHPVVLPHHRDGNGPERPIALVPEDQIGAHTGCDVIPVPDSWRIVATMNVFDKALLYEMSYALMRRFAFVEVPVPPTDVVLELIDQSAAPDPLATHITKRLHRVLTRDGTVVLGPAIFQDVGRYLTRRLLVENSTPEEDLALEAFASYALAQFEGADAETGRRLFASMSEIVGDERVERLRRMLNDALGLELGAADEPDEQNEDE